MFGSVVNAVPYAGFVAPIAGSPLVPSGINSFVSAPVNAAASAFFIGTTIAWGSLKIFDASASIAGALLVRRPVFGGIAFGASAAVVSCIMFADVMHALERPEAELLHRLAHSILSKAHKNEWAQNMASTLQRQYSW